MASPNPSSPSIPSSSAASSRTASPSSRAPTSTREAQSLQGSSRRPNRNALRDYYNLSTVPTSINNKSSAANTSNASKPISPHAPKQTAITNDTTTTTTTSNSTSLLDTPNFSPQSHIQTLLSTSSLPALLRAESALINEIKSLDGEKKALVYDNYSKLIVATETMGKMRRNMDPLTPTTSMLGPSVGYIAETANALREKGSVVVAAKSAAGGGENAETTEMKREKGKQVETVKWVLNTPRRLGALLEKGERDSAEKDWTEVKGLLGKWRGVSGVEEVRDQCERIMARQ